MRNAAWQVYVEVTCTALARWHMLSLSFYFIYTVIYAVTPVSPQPEAANPFMSLTLRNWGCRSLRPQSQRGQALLVASYVCLTLSLIQWHVLHSIILRLVVNLHTKVQAKVFKEAAVPGIMRIGCGRPTPANG